MSIVLLLIPLGIVLVVLAAAALIWAVDSGQYDGDLDESSRIVLEPDEPSDGNPGAPGGSALGNPVSTPSARSRI